MSGWRLLLTRPDEECAALAASLGEAGVHSSSLPLLAIDPLEETPEQRTLMLDLDRYCAVVVVSKPAARLALERLDRYWPQPPQQTWCSVGAATAAILEAYGLDVTYPEQGDDSEALLALPAFQDSLRVHDPKVLIMRGQGVQVDYLPLYRRRAPDYPAGELLARVRAERLNGLVVSSGQGLQNLYQLAAADWPEIGRLPLFVPSPRVAEMARELGAQRVIDCRGASAPALLAALTSAA